MTLDLPDAPNPKAVPVESPASEPAPETTAQASDAPAPEPTQPAEDAAAPEVVATTEPEMPEMELLDQVWTAYRAQLQASIEQQAAAVTAEEAKQAYDQATEKTEVRRQELRSLLDSFCERLAAIRDPQSAAMVAHVQNVMQDAPAPAASPSAASTGKKAGTAMPYDAWCKLPTTRVIAAGVPGLGEKKASALVDAFPTVGDLESARTEASKANKHFCKMLGKGFGEKTADAIETIMSDLLMLPESEPQPAPRQPERKPNAIAPETVSQEEVEAAPVAEAEATGAETEDTLPFDADEPEDSPVITGMFDDGETYEDADEVDDIYADLDDEDEAQDGDSGDDSEYLTAEGSPDDEDEETWADACYQKLLNDPAEQKSGWGDAEKVHSEAWTKGNKAQADWPVSACPYDESSEMAQALDWVRGWTAASVLAMDI